MLQREKNILSLKNNPNISVLIVGAGINGIGTFRELSLQGIDVVLVDSEDFCSGASAASSHMVHGGIRYLENGEFSLVREAVHERNRLIENAPHLVKPLPTTFPIFKWFSGLLNAPLKFLGLLERPSERGAVVIKIGMLLYDYYTRQQKTVPKHVFRNRAESLKLFPKINPEVIFTGTYYDGAMPSPERIAIEVMNDGRAANERAVALNYIELVSASGKTVVLKDRLNGEVFEVQPQILVNATGPWIDLVNGRMGEEARYISGTKGSHIVLDHPELRQAIGENEFFFENRDGRIVLIFPMFDKVMIGTSDIPVDDPNSIVVTNQEVDYFFDMVTKVFPEIRIKREHIVYTLSGVRPLQHSSGRNAGQMSRNHKVQVCETGDLLDIPVLSLVGGKWTSFRAFSSQAADAVLTRLNIKRSVSTVDLPIGGSKGFPQSETEKESYLKSLNVEYGADLAWLERLFDRYGTKTRVILETQGDKAFQPLDSIPDYSIGELRYLIDKEDVLHLDDLLLRRTTLVKLGRITSESLPEVAAICAKALKWTGKEKTDEVNRFNQILEKNHRLKFNQYIG